MAAKDRSIYEIFTIKSNDGAKTIDLRGGVVAFSYFENLFSPMITAQVLITVTGNIIPSSEDAIDINKWKNDALHHPESIKLYREIVNQGLSDILRVFNSKSYEFTYWDYSRGSWEKDNGLRIDHFLASPSAVDRIYDCQIEKKFRGLERPSDHVPIWFDIK